jgi:hypothetical protein
MATRTLWNVVNRRIMSLIALFILRQAQDERFEMGDGVIVEKGGSEILRCAQKDSRGESLRIGDRMRLPGEFDEEIA